MSKKSNPAVTGGFVLGAIALLVAGTVIFGGADLFTSKKYMVTYFDGSVKGLRVGSNVLFRGVRVGYVTDIEVVTDTDVDKIAIPVTFQILPESFTVVSADGKTKAMSESPERLKSLIDRGLRAKLETESFVTGQLLIQLDFYPDVPAVYRGERLRYPEIPSAPSDIQQVLQRLEKLMTSLASKFDEDQLISDIQGILSGLNKLANSPDLEATLAGLNKLSNAPATQALPADLHGAVTTLNATLQDTRKVVGQFDTELGPLLGETRKTLDTLTTALERAAGLLKESEHQLGEEGAARIELLRTLEEVQRTARSLRGLTEELQLQPESIIWGKPDQKESP